MTTEVLRNMIYAASPTLDGLRYVVLDEVHYLQDRYRGPVWEEVIIHLPPEVDLVCLSATVSNAEEVAAWIETVRGEHRGDHRGAPPGRARAPATSSASGAPTQLHLLPTFVAGPDGELRPNPDAARLDARNARDPGWRGRPRTRLRTPSRVETVELLAAESMLPAIAFIFSRTGCDQAVEQCLAAGLRLTEPHERARIRDDRRRQDRRPRRRRPRRARLRPVAGGLGGGLRRPPRGHGAADEGGGRGGVRRPAW